MEAAGSFGRDPQKCLQSEQARKQKKMSRTNSKAVHCVMKGYGAEHSWKPYKSGERCANMHVHEKRKSEPVRSK